MSDSSTKIPSPSKGTILVVEDDEVVAALEKRHLERAGYTVEVVGNGEKAMERLRQGGIDLAVLDYQLPGGKTGLDFYHEIKQVGIDLPIIVVTGFNDETTVITALRAGVRDFITKSKQYLDYLPEAVGRVLAQEKTKHALVKSDIELKLSSSLLRSTLEATADGILVVDSRGQIADFNTQFVEMWDIPTEILHSKDDQKAIQYVLNQLTHPEEFSAKVQELYSRPLEKSIDLLEFKDGRTFERFSQPQILDGNPVGRVWSFRDVTAHKQAEERLGYMAHHDALTGLPNRALFYDRLTQGITRLPWCDRLAAVLFLDIDRFKLINDTLGHGTADLMLKAVAERLVSCVRDGDTVARLGGDEFTVLLVDMAAKEDVGIVAQKILESIAQPYDLDGQQFYVTTSIGICIYPPDGADAATLIKNADSAMYAAKEQEGNNYQFYSNAMSNQSSGRLMMENALHHALERNEFILYYQPLLDFTSGRFAGVEALLRWNKDGELISPAQFIPLAEETGLIVPIGEWVLRTACAQNKAWQEQGFPPMRVAVNLSARQLQLPHLKETIEAILIETGLQPCYLELELTESMMQSLQATGTLRALKELGVHLAIDDFGTGYSSLSHLQRYPLHKLKIDQSFMRNLPADENNVAIVTAIVAMAQSLNLKVTAEGVETAEQLAFLRTLQCDELQGYLLSRPLPVADLTNLLQKNPLFPQQFK